MRVNGDTREELFEKTKVAPENTVEFPTGNRLFSRNARGMAE
jgi:hypothetical protein